MFALVLDCGAATPRDYPIVFKAGQKTAYAYGQFSNNIQEVYFSFYAHAGQQLRVTIRPLTRGLITAGAVIYPSLKEDGGPGGVIFDSELTETGKYRVRVTQRHPNVNGRFRVLIEISPEENKKDSKK